MSRFFCNDLPMPSHHYAFSDVSLIYYKPKYSFCQIFSIIKLYCSGITYINSKKVKRLLSPHFFINNRFKIFFWISHHFTKCTIGWGILRDSNRPLLQLSSIASYFSYFTIYWLLHTRKNQSCFLSFYNIRIGNQLKQVLTAYSFFSELQFFIFKLQKNRTLLFYDWNYLTKTVLWFIIN